jgi:hypothetical protein
MLGARDDVEDVGEGILEKAGPACARRARPLDHACYAPLPRLLAASREACMDTLS